MKQSPASIGLVFGLGVLLAAPSVLHGQYGPVIFTLEQAAGVRGETVDLTMAIESSLPVEGFNFGFLYDARKADLVSITPRSGGTDWAAFEHFVFDRDNSSFWRDDFWGRAVFGPGRTLQPSGPGRTRHEVLELRFRVREDAPSGRISISFNNHPGDLDWMNEAFTTYGTQAAFVSDVRYQGWILVDPPLGVPFLRGDVNGDGQVSISDAAMLRRLLFIDRQVPGCADAADADDSGYVNITDAIRILDHVFQAPLDESQSQLASPYPEAGMDVGLDPLPCDSYGSQPPLETEDLVRLSSVEAGAGEPVEVPIYITSHVPVEAVQLMVRYDPALFTPTVNEVDVTGGALGSFAPIGYNSVRTIAEGLLAVGMVGHWFEEGYEIPAGEGVLAGKLKGVIAAGIPPGAEVRLDLDNGPGGEGWGIKKLRNELTHQGSARLVSVLPRLEGMAFRIVSDITFFRADSNSDGQVQLSDAVFTLSHMFLGGDPPACPDAADADDSGRVQMNDAVLTLSYLFQGTAIPALPHPYRGHDYEPDALGPCRGANP